jgi:hypothetical protein
MQGINQPSTVAATVQTTTRQNSPPGTTTARQKKKPMSATKFNNFPTTLKYNVHAGSSTSTVDDIKGIMGQAKYKKLKQHTKEFGSGDIDPDTYVEVSVSLFDNGYTDVNFWLIVPSLIESCPHVSSRSAISCTTLFNPNIGTE